jgi:outer membrane protein OmpA-like peptidoglycan-associated protein
MSDSARLSALTALKIRNNEFESARLAELANVNAKLINTKPGSDTERCLLWEKNQLLDLPNVKGRPIAKGKRMIIEKEIRTYIYDSTRKEMVMKTSKDFDFIGPKQMEANNLPVQRVESTVYYKPDSNSYMNKADYQNLRIEIDKLRGDVAKYREMAAKSDSNQTPIIVKRPLFGRRQKQDASNEEAMQIAIAKLRKELKPTIIRDTIVIEKVVEKPVIQYVDKVVEKVIERPTIQYVDKVVEKPVDRVVEKVVEKTVTKVEQLLSLPPDVILFDVGKSIVKAQYNTRLSYYATQLKKFPELNVTLNGYTDNSGNAAANQRLSEARAKAVKAFLMSKGVAENQISFNYAGADNPIADNGSAASKSQNRRVEISFNK